MVQYFCRAVLLILISCSAHAAGLSLSAKSWLVADGSGKIIESYHSNDIRSIASITKLMTVMVVLDKKQPLDEKVEQFTRGELIQLALVRSDNRAAELLCRYYPGGTASCVRDMNYKAEFLGMPNTSFVEATGLSVMNVSTATELINLVQAAEHYPEINKAAETNQIKIKIRNKWFIFHNTNPIIGKRHKFIVSKTGFINASGGCIVLKLETDIGSRIVVVLGSKNTRTRIPEAEFIAENY